MTKTDTNLKSKMRQIDSELFTELMDLLCEDMNLGAGIQISGDSGSGKSNLGEQLFIRSFENGIPSIYFDPHGDSTKKILRLLLERSESRAQKRLIYLNPADLSTAFGFNPLQATHDPDDVVPYEAQILKRVETTAKIIFSLFGESEFEGRTKLRQYLTLWISMLAKSGLTLSDASLFADPDSPVYRQLLELAPDGKARNKLAKLIGQKPSEIDKEIGSTESRVMPILAHPVCQTMFSRKENNLDFRWLIENDYSLLVDLSMSGEAGDGREYPDALTEEVQQLICNLMLNQYLDVLKTVPLPKRKRRLLFIDELPVFESSGPQLMKACTEIRKYQTKFVFMHQGSTRFPGGTENEFFQAVSKMCAANIYFRHTGEDAEHFARPIARRFFDPLQIKYEHWVDQEFSLEPEIIELLSTNSGTVTTSSGSETKSSQLQTTNSESTTQTQSDGMSHAESKGDAVRRQNGYSPDSEYATDSSNVANTSSSGSSLGTSTANSTSKAEGVSEQDGWSKSNNESTTKSQAILSRSEVRKVLQSVQFKGNDEQEIEAINLIEMQPTGEAIVVVKGVGIVRANVPETKEEFPHLKSIVSRSVRQFFEKQLQLPWFSNANEEYRKRLEFEASISGYLQNLIRERQGRTNPGIKQNDVQLRLTHDLAGNADGEPVKAAQSESTKPQDDLKPKVSQNDPDWYDGDF